MAQKSLGASVISSLCRELDENRAILFFILEPLKKERICCLETSVRNYHYALRNDPEERSSHLALGV
jgi:hypothetical protein